MTSHSYTRLDADHLDLRSIFQILIVKKWLILTMGFIVFSLAMIYTVSKPTKYQARILLKIQNKQHNSFGGIANPNQQTGLANMPEEPIAVQIALIRSDYILRPVIQSLGFQSDMIKKIRSNLNIVDLSSSSDSMNNKVAILQLSLTGDDPALITHILNEIAATTKQKDIILKSQEAEKTLEFMRQQLPLIHGSLKKAEAKLNHYRSTNGRIDIKLQTQYLVTQLSDIDEQLKKLRVKKITMLQQYTTFHPFVIALNQERIELEKQRLELIKQLKKLPASDQQDVNLTREVDVKNNLYTLLLNQIHQYEVMQAGIISDIQILTPVITPDVLAPIKMSIVGLFSFVIGMILASLGILSWRIFTRRIDDPNWTERIWNIKNLAVIPYSKIQANNSIAYKSKIQRALPLLAYNSPSDMAIESLCNLRTFIQLNLDTTQNNIIAIMGLTKGIGKTFITANLASLLARTHNKVLLIDADVRGGHMHQYFDMPATPGLTDVVHGTCSIEHALIKSKHFENLSFLSSGKRPEKPADLLMSDHFKALLTTLSADYPYIFINTAQNIFTTDTALIGALANMNLLVLGSNMHESFEIDMAIKNLNHAGIKVHGCIFNNPKSIKHKKYYYSQRKNWVASL